MKIYCYKGCDKIESADYHYDNRIPIEEAANHTIAAYFERGD